MAMPNVFSLLRLANLFTPSQQSATPNFVSDLANRGVSMNDPGMSAPSTYNPDQDFLNLYKPRTAISDAYTQSLLNPPERTSPGTLRNIGALIGSTLTNLKTPDRTLDTFNNVRFAPYNRQMEDWTTRTKALGLGASEEDRSNINARLLAQEQVRARENEAKINETERAHRASEKQKADTLEETKRKNDAYIWRQTHPNWQAAKTKGGTLVYVDPTNPQNTYDTGISLGTMTDQEMQNLIANRQMNEIQARGDIQKDIANERIRAAQDLQDKRAWTLGTMNNPDGTTKNVLVNSITGEVKDVKAPGPITKTGTTPKPSTAAGSKGLTPSQEVTADYRKAKQAVLEHPEWAKFIHIDDTHKSFTVDAPSTGGFFSSGPDRNTYNQISGYLTGKQVQQYDPKIEKTIDDAIKAKLYGSREEVVAALRKKGVIK